MSEFVNKVKKDNQEYNIQDARIPEALSEDAGKVLRVADAGGWEIGETGGMSVIQFGSFGSGWSSKTVSELYEAVNETDGVYIVNAIQYSTIEGLLVKIKKSDSSFYVSIITTEGDNYKDAGVSGSTVIDSLVQIRLPQKPFDAPSETYVLKCVNGTIKWVKETA